MANALENFKSGDFLEVTICFNVISLGFLTAVAFFLETSGWVIALLGFSVLFVMNMLWLILFMVFSAMFLFGIDAVRGLLNFVLRRKNRSPQPEATPSDSEAKLFQALRWSSISLIIVPVVCLLGVALVDIFTTKSLTKAYLIFVSHGCVGLVGWLLGMRALIVPLPIGMERRLIEYLQESPTL